MKAPITIAAVTSLLVGVLFGFLWWGTAARRIEESHRALQAQQAETDTTREELRSTKAKLRQTEEELRAERERRSQLEVILSQGRK